MPVSINGTTGVTAPEVTLDNATADGGQVVLRSSGFNNWNLDNFSGRLRAYYNATEQLGVTADGVLQFNSGYGSPANAYGCRAWVNFNGTGTVAIRASGNVSSITDLGVGTYRVNFASTMPDANYSAVFSAGQFSVTMGTLLQVATYTTTSVIVYTYENNASVDLNTLSVAIFR